MNRNHMALLTMRVLLSAMVIAFAQDRKSRAIKEFDL
jgi:hypothetical protein